MSKFSLSRQALLLSSASDEEDLIQSETEEVTKDWGIIHDPLHPQARGIVTKLKTKTIAGWCLKKNNLKIADWQGVCEYEKGRLGWKNYQRMPSLYWLYN